MKGERVKENIVLVGFMGVGKGRTARCLAEMTGRYALDCDDLIESYTNSRIRKIFQEDGEAVFRELEKKQRDGSKNMSAERLSPPAAALSMFRTLRRLAR